MHWINEDGHLAIVYSTLRIWFKLSPACKWCHSVNCVWDILTIIWHVWSQSIDNIRHSGDHLKQSQFDWNSFGNSIWRSPFVGMINGLKSAEIHLILLCCCFCFFFFSTRVPLIILMAPDIWLSLIFLFSSVKQNNTGWFSFGAGVFRMQ